MKWFWMWIGGAITHVAGTGLVIGIFIVADGAAPGQAVADLLTNLPPWLTNPWFRLALVIIGLAILALHYISTYGRCDKKQSMIWRKIYRGLFITYLTNAFLMKST